MADEKLPDGYEKKGELLVPIGMEPKPPEYLIRWEAWETIGVVGYHVEAGALTPPSPRPPQDSTWTFPCNACGGQIPNHPWSFLGPQSHDRHSWTCGHPATYTCRPCIDAKRPRASGCPACGCKYEYT